MARKRKDIRGGAKSGTPTQVGRTSKAKPAAKAYRQDTPRPSNKALRSLAAGRKKSARLRKQAQLLADAADHCDNSTEFNSTAIVPPLSVGEDTDIQPRPPRRRRRADSDRGLPSDQELADLANEYLLIQRQLWPELVGKGFLSEPGPKVIAAMVADFKHRHRGGNPDGEPLQALVRANLKLFGLYGRYSCDNSSPKSIVDQAVSCLREAKEKKVFIPWQYVYCDYSVSGLDSTRLGYSSYRAVLKDKESLIAGTFIDDFTRASRDALEWWRLAALSHRVRKQLYGASDKFDLSNENAEVLISVFTMLSKLFIRTLRQKVLRGMKGAARRHTSLGKPPLGFTRRVIRDAGGEIVRRPSGRPIHEPCWDPITHDAAVMIFKLFYVKSRSTWQIMKICNRLKVDGWDGWTDAGIRLLLRNPAYIGVFIWNKAHSEMDETGKRVKVVKPMSEWEFYYDASLAMVSMEWWFGTQAKLDAMTGPGRLSRNQVQATTLFSGTLVCDYCFKEAGQSLMWDGELKLARSCEKYKSLGCPNGAARRHGCKLTTSKSTRIIETCLLGFLQDVVLPDNAAETLLAKCNPIVKQEAAKPLVNVAPLKAEVRALKSKIDKLVRLSEDDEDEDLCAGYKTRIKELQRDLNAKTEQIRKAERQKTRRLEPLTLERVQFLLQDLRGLLNGDIPAAAEAIRAITGPIRIRQEKIPGRRRGARWIATFTPDLLGALAQRARAKGYPESITLEWI